jgi:holo-[acyl-carrier protein] synthase
MIHGIGVDIVQLDRIRHALETYGDRFLNRIFCLHEIETCEATGDERVVCYAARFAAKEAAFKAFGDASPSRNDLGDALSWHDFEVRVGDDGAATLVLSDRATEASARLGITHIHLSLSHTRVSASAIVVAEK